MDSLDDLRRTFFQECDELLADLETGLLAVRDGTGDGDTVNAVFRAVHSIKGGAGAFQLTDLVSFAHGYENVLDAMRSDRIDLRPELADLMLRAADTLADLVRAAGEGGATPEWGSTLEELDRVLEEAGGGDELGDFAAMGFAPIMLDFGDGGGEAFDAVAAPEGRSDTLPGRPSGEAWRVTLRPLASLYAIAHDPLPLLREMQARGARDVACDLSTLPPLERLDPAGGHLAWSLTIDGDPATVLEVLDFVEEDVRVAVEPLGPPGDPAVARGWRDSSAPVPGDGLFPAAVQVHPAPAQTPAQALAGDGSPPERASEPMATPVRAPLGPPPAAGSSPAPSPLSASRPAAAGDEGTAPTIRVDLERVDRLINLVGELVISQAMLGQRAAEAGVAGTPAVAAGLDELRRLTRDIQDSVMAIRAQPVKGLFLRMGRIVREVAAATGKTVRLRTDGEATEVDKTVVERLADPLTHLIRNAVDHGLEAPERRQAAGKPPEGVVHLSAAHRSGRIVIEIADDGAGIDRARVRETAERRGLIAPDAQLSDGEIDNLLFLPGFSTAKSVSDISGRGVGMDVVKRSIQALGGRLALASRPGHGTRLTMSLPLTLAVLDGMVVTVAGQTLVVPLTAVVETLKPGAADIHRLGGGTRLLAIRGGFVPLVDVGRQLGFDGDGDPGPAPPGLADASGGTDGDGEGSADGVAILVETAHGARFALHVEAIQEQRQVVIKSLESNYGTIPGVAAATILGDGRVALILDLDTLLSDPGAAPPTGGAAAPPSFTPQPPHLAEGARA